MRSHAVSVRNDNNEKFDQCSLIQFVISYMYAGLKETSFTVCTQPRAENRFSNIQSILTSP